MRITTVRGSGQANSASTGTPKRAPTRNVTSTRNRSSASTASSAGADTTRSRAKEYGWNQAPCQGSRRFATTSTGSHTPVILVTAARLSRSGGRDGVTGRGRGVSPPARFRRTHTSTPSSQAGSGRQSGVPPAASRRPCHRQSSSPETTRPSASGAPRCGHAPGPATGAPARSRQTTSSRPATRAAYGRPDRTSRLAATTNQLPDTRARARFTAAAISAGSASSAVGACASQRERGTGVNGHSLPTEVPDPSVDGG